MAIVVVTRRKANFEQVLAEARRGAVYLMSTGRSILMALGLLAALANSAPLFAQTSATRQPLITAAIDEAKLVSLAGNTHPEANAANDRGPVANDFPLEHLYLQLKSATQVRQSEDALIPQLHDPTSPSYHQWLTVDQIGERFGPARKDIETVADWLSGHGFTVSAVYAANGVIDFSGTASQVRAAFHTEIHHLEVNGKQHIANMTDPKIPAALAPAIEGIVSLHDFFPHRALVMRPQLTTPYTPGVDVYLVAPDDLYTIYDFRPIYAAGVSGQGQTIAVLEDSDVYSAADWTTFRATFGLSQRFPMGSFAQVHPQPGYFPGNSGPCADPGATGDDGEAIGDAEWASASAPNAAIVVAACANTATNFGALIALQNLLAGANTPPPIISFSYAYPEVAYGAAGNAYIDALYTIAVLQGVSLFVVTGDIGTGSYIDPSLFFESTLGIQVNALASTPNNVAVGGTDFADTFFGTNSSYWSSTNGAYFESALSYVPETTWNESCASPLIVAHFGYAVPYGADGFCNSPAGSELLDSFAGSGGPSGCAYGAPSIIAPGSNPGLGLENNVNWAVVSGTCKGYAKPLYQQLVSGNPADGVRDLPDVALFASGGVWGHFYIGCDSDVNNYGAPCAGPPTNYPTDWTGMAGTSIASPIVAGVQAMINQATGQRWGNPDFVYYALAAVQNRTAGPGCNATLGNQIGAHCIFHDVTLGNNAVDCGPLVVGSETIGTFNCYLPSGSYGVASLSNTAYQPAYPATPGWDFATGLGSIDAYNLVKSWPGSRLP
jgi:subtilase family serine protease